VLCPTLLRARFRALPQGRFSGPKVIPLVLASHSAPSSLMPSVNITYSHPWDAMSGDVTPTTRSTLWKEELPAVFSCVQVPGPYDMINTNGLHRGASEGCLWGSFLVFNGVVRVSRP
jgi:hypothetical protein